MAHVPASANKIIPLKEVKQTGKPSSDLSKPNYNPLLILHGDAYDLGFQLGKKTAHNIADAVKWTVLSSIDFVGGSGQAHSASEIDALISREEQQLLIYA